MNIELLANQHGTSIQLQKTANENEQVTVDTQFGHVVTDGVCTRINIKNAHISITCDGVGFTEINLNPLVDIDE